MNDASTQYLLDTNILVHLVRGDALGQQIQAAYGLMMAIPRPLISVVSDGELRSLAYQFRWGERHVDQALFLLDYFKRVAVDTVEVLHTYAVIDAQSRRMGVKMGKNDVWIAAAAHVTGATLLTTDRDFEHLPSDLLTRIPIDAS